MSDARYCGLQESRAERHCAGLVAFAPVLWSESVAWLGSVCVCGRLRMGRDQQAARIGVKPRMCSRKTC